MRSGTRCLLFLLAWVAPGIAGPDRTDESVDLSVPPGEAFFFEALLVPGRGGAEVRADRRDDDVEFRILFKGGTLHVPGAAGPVDCDPDALHAVDIACAPGPAGWVARLTVTEDATGRVLFQGQIHLPASPRRVRVRADSVLHAALA